MPRSSYTLDVVDGVYCVVDEDLPGRMSVTNDAENVVADIVSANRDDPNIDKARIVYRDSDGVWDELSHSGRIFTGFRAWRCNSRAEILERIKEKI